VTRPFRARATLRRRGRAIDVIATESLCKRYGARLAIEDLELRVPAGSVFGFIGPNGAGKTTAIRMLLGFLRPDAGTARVFGLDCWRESPRVKRRIGYVPGDLRLYGWMTGAQALQITGAARGRDVRSAGAALAAELELDLSVRVRNFSRGMRQKLGLILALAHDPELLILDEPTSALDPLTQVRLHRHLRAAAARGRTVFFSSHVLSEVEHLCERVAIVRDGRLVADESLAALRARAPRRVMIAWGEGRDPGVATAPPFLRVRAEAGAWRGELIGAASDLLAWLQGRDVRDFIVEAPDLDSLFRSYYRAGDEP
jgi:ABC-2 type transport system ATP-binding protein